MSLTRPVAVGILTQGLQQGGAFVFEGERLLFQHRDPSTGAHADLNTLLRVALEAWVILAGARARPVVI